MKTSRFIILLALWFVLGGLFGCSSAEKAANQRRNLMMPEKSDLPRNSKYKAPKKKKTYKRKKKKRRSKRLTYHYLDAVGENSRA